jgi:predicted TIM-barrel fold metal-dependent hydrolase
MIIDGDGHFVEPPTLWQDYVPDKLHDSIYMRFDADGMAERLFLGEFNVKVSKYGDAFTPGGYKKEERKGRHLEEASPGAWDPQFRLRLHDEEGIDAAVLYPSFGLAVPALSDKDIAVGASQAVNDWAAEYCGAAPNELYAAATLPMHFPEEAAKELRRCVNSFGFVAGIVRASALRDGRSLRHPSFEPIWQAACELGVAISVHNAGFEDELDYVGKDRAETFVLRHSLAHAVEAEIAFGELYESRVFDRFPDLRVGFMESGCGWTVPWIEKLDEHCEMAGWRLNPPLTRRASEVFREQCTVGAEGEESMVGFVQEHFGNDSVIWASDYPHLDSEPPYVEQMRKRTDLSPTQFDGCMQQAALRFYGLDAEAITSATEKRRSS